MDQGFTFATPTKLPDSWDAGQDRATQGAATQLFNDWLDKTSKHTPNATAQRQADPPAAACTQDNVESLGQGDRYEGHTADLLFTRWLANTEAVLSPMPPGQQSGAATPATLSHFASTPSADILALPGHPLSMMQAVDKACRSKTLGGGWYEDSPLPSQPAFAAWRGSAASSCSTTPDKHSRNSNHHHEEDDGDDHNQGQQRLGVVGRGWAGPRQARRAAVQDALVSQIQDTMSMLSVGGVTDMQISPMLQPKRGGGIPASPAAQVVRLMMTPDPIKRRPTLAPQDDTGGDQGAPGVGGQLDLGGGLPEPHTPDMAGWGTEEEEEEESSDIDLADMGFTPMAMSMAYQAMSPMQELIDLMMTPQPAAPL